MLQIFESETSFFFTKYYNNLKTTHLFRVFPFFFFFYHYFYLWLRSIPYIGMIRNILWERGSNEHDELWCPMQSRNRNEELFMAPSETYWHLSFFLLHLSLPFVTIESWIKIFHSLKDYAAFAKSSFGNI